MVDLFDPEPAAALALREELVEAFAAMLAGDGDRQLLFELLIRELEDRCRNLLFSGHGAIMSARCLSAQRRPEMDTTGSEPAPDPGSGGWRPGDATRDRFQIVTSLPQTPGG